MAVKKYSDGKFHASDAEAVLSKLKETIEKTFEAEKAVLLTAIAQKAFDLGFQCANEYYEEKKRKDIEEYGRLGADELQELFTLQNLLLNAADQIEPVKEKSNG